MINGLIRILLYIFAFEHFYYTRTIMMRVKSLSFLFGLLLMLSTYLYSGEVEVRPAGDVAKNFYYEQVAQARGIAYNNLLILDYYTAETNGVSDYHVFNFDNGGWVIVAGDDLVKPILAYGTEGYYDPSNGSPSHLAWMEQYKAAIEHYRQQALEDAAIDALWSHYSTHDISSLQRPGDRGDVEPFMRSQWGQGKYYNAMCPDDPAGDDGHALVGCVATSMSQVMYYFRHPEVGQGSHGYYANNGGSGYGDYGWLSVNFGATTYDYEGMNDNIGGSNATLAAAELCYHAGVGVDMAYGPNASGSQTEYAAAALKAYFRYSGAVSHMERYQYSNTAWHNLLKSNLSGQKPVIYAGTQPQGSGHAWVFDGYDTTNQGTFYHCNWGWNGMSDGYFTISNLAPGSEPAFSAYQSAIINIYPAGAYPPNCNSTRTVTSRHGSITDGSGPSSDYADNSDCMWLIDPADSIDNIYLNVEYLDVADDNDVLTIYDGATTSDPILGTFNLTNQPSGQIGTTGGKALVRFTSDGSGRAQGFQLTYKSTNPNFCGSGTSITQPTGTISDGSGTSNYAPNATCSWLIDPGNSDPLTLHFTNFDVKSGDYINVYDWGSQSVLLNKYSGSSPPADVTANSGSIYIEFRTDWAEHGAGWQADFTNVGTEEHSFKNISIYPVPASERLIIEFEVDGIEDVSIQIMDITGKILKEKIKAGVNGNLQTVLNVDDLSQGIYILKAESESGTLTRKITID